MPQVIPILNSGKFLPEIFSYMYIINKLRPGKGYSVFSYHGLHNINFKHHE